MARKVHSSEVTSGKSQKYIETDIAYIALIAPLQAPQYIVLYSFP